MVFLFIIGWVLSGLAIFKISYNYYCKDMSDGDLMGCFIFHILIPPMCLIVLLIRIIDLYSKNIGSWIRKIFK